jgi:hypothetical protein
MLNPIPVSSTFLTRILGFHHGRTSVELLHLCSILTFSFS